MQATKPVLSKVGQRLISFPSSVKLNHQAPLLTVEGPRGKLSLTTPSFITLDTIQIPGSDTKRLKISVENSKERHQRAMWGTTNALIDNMITGVTEGFSSFLRIVGVGYRAQILKVNGKDVLDLKCGYSHPVQLEIPSGIQVQVQNPQRVKISGNDLQQVKQFAHNARRFRPPEPYNQKGIFVDDETIRKKEGKKK